MLVSEICTLDPKACRRESNLSEVAGIMWEHDCGVVPVVDETGHAVGMITDRDVCIAVATRNRLASHIRVGEIIREPAVACRPDDEVRTALRLMREAQVRRLAVVDEAGRLLGILSLRDVIRAAGGGQGQRAKERLHQDLMLTLMVLSQGPGARTATIPPQVPAAS